MEIVDGKLVKYDLEEIADLDNNRIIVRIPDDIIGVADELFKGEPIDTIIFPNSLKYIGNGTFKDTKYLQSIEMPSVTEIGDYAFENSGIRVLVCPPDLEKIGESAFDNSYISYITFNNKLKSIGEEAFSYSSIREAVLPDSLTSIGTGVFYGCSSLESVTIPKRISFLPDFFCGYSSLKSVDIPPNIAVIGEEAFCGCRALSSVIFHDGLKTIANGAFGNCSNLTEVKFPKTLERIGIDAFTGCAGLKEVVLPENLEIIGETAFSGCRNLERVEIGDNLAAVSPGAFSDCVNLKEVKLGKNVKTIAEASFCRCVNLHAITIPEGVETIKNSAFSYTGLEEIVLPSTIKEIDKMAFYCCKDLKKVTILSKEKAKIELDSFASCPSIEEVTIENAEINDLSTDDGNYQNIKTFKFGKDCTVYFNCTRLPAELKYLCKVGDYFVLSRIPMSKDFIEIDSVSRQINIGVITSLWDNKDKLFDLLKNREELCPLLNTLYEKHGKEEVADFVNNARFNFYDQCKKQVDAMQYYLGFFYSLGGFTKPMTEQRQSKKGNKIETVVDYAQRTGEFFKIAKTKLTMSEYEKLTRAMMQVKPEKFNPETAKFLLNMDNIKEILSMPEESLLSRVVSFFEDVQDTNKSRKGSQRQLAPTVDKFRSYFATNKFKNVSKEDESLAEFLSKYYDEQETYEKAVEIKKEKKEKGVAESILGYHLEEKEAFKNIDKLSLEISKIAGEALDSLLESTNDYTFDWLEKSDPHNYILGILCNCCAQLESAGYGIMHASIVDPDVQNLVIRDKEGKIIAKSTLYINREEGYGVFNNIQINSEVLLDEKIKIYKKYKLAVATFAREYNRLHPDKPLKQINIGMRINDLEDLLEENDKQAEYILEAIDYGKYGRDGKAYNGDSNSRQMVIWEDEKQ